MDNSPNSPGSPLTNADWMGWIPVGIRWEETNARIDWCYLEGHRFTEPFFDQTIEQQRREMAAARQSIRTTSLEALDNFPLVPPPAGFIFHMSRCGSTLVAQMLAAVPRFTVISEASILSTIVHPPAHSFADDPELQVRLLRQVVNALAQPRARQAAPCFIKFSSRDILQISLIQRAFPTVPWIFLYREPLEVVSALLGKRSDSLPPGLIELGLLEEDSETAKSMSPAEFWTRVLSRQCRTALQTFESVNNGRLVNYQQLPDIVWNSLLGNFGVACTDEEIAAMREAGKFNAKNPTKLFEADSERKQSLATAETRVIVDELLRPYYEQLEAIRINQRSAG